MGRAIVDALLAEGASPAVVDRDRAALDGLAGSRPGITCHACDLADEEAVADAFYRIAAERARLDGLVHAAGRIASAPLNSPFGQPPRHSLAAWRGVLSDNLTTAFLAGACAADEMLRTRSRGALVLITSLAAQGNPGQTAYSAAKAGAEAMVKGWGKELGPSGIRAVAVAPGFVEAESTRAALSESAVQARVRAAPLRRLGRPEEVAEAILFALRNDYVNATTLHVDGGSVV